MQADPSVQVPLAGVINEVDGPHSDCSVASLRTEKHCPLDGAQASTRRSMGSDQAATVYTVLVVVVEVMGSVRRVSA